mgnify:CR=1 FL=1
MQLPTLWRLQDIQQLPYQDARASTHAFMTAGAARASSAVWSAGCCTLVVSWLQALINIKSTHSYLNCQVEYLMCCLGLKPKPTLDVHERCPMTSIGSVLYQNTGPVLHRPLARPYRHLITQVPCLASQSGAFKPFRCRQPLALASRAQLSKASEADAADFGASRIQATSRNLMVSTAARSDTVLPAPN